VALKVDDARARLVVASCAALALCALVLTGCRFPAALQGKVTTLPAAGANGQPLPERPIPAAVVEIVCAQRTVLRTKSDGAGRFAAEFDADLLSDDCTIRVSSAGYRTRSYAVREACAENACQAISLPARLLAEREP
jgi:hypothetical protein